MGHLSQESFFWIATKSCRLLAMTKNNALDSASFVILSEAKNLKNRNSSLISFAQNDKINAESRNDEK
ncbi:hypothetical protein ACWIUD_07720 [Helicobacter sp. 23-1044]